MTYNIVIYLGSIYNVHYRYLSMMKYAFISLSQMHRYYIVYI